MLPSITISRARRRGPTESAKTNNFFSQVKRDTNVLRKKIDEHESQIASNMSTLSTSLAEAQRRLVELEDRIKYGIKNSI